MTAPFFMTKVTCSTAFDVVEGIAGDGDDVCEEVGLELADLIFPS